MRKFKWINFFIKYFCSVSHTFFRSFKFEIQGQISQYCPQPISFSIHQNKKTRIEKLFFQYTRQYCIIILTNNSRPDNLEKMFCRKQFLNFKSTLALINTLVGSAILLLPILYLQNGIILFILFLTCSGFFSFYSCILCLDHLNSQQNYFRDCIDRHMKKKIFPFYEICCFISNIIMKQWKGLFYHFPQICQWMELGTLISLIFFTLLLRKFEMGITLMAFGLLSTVFYCFFIFWIFSNRPQPSNGENSFPLMKESSIADLLAVFATAFSIQNVFVQILRKNPEQKSYKKIIIITFLTGYAIYLFIGVFGGLALLNRKPITAHPRSIMDYFNADTWQPFTLYTLYLIHLYSVWPEWSNVNAKRLMALIGLQPTQINTGIHAVLSPCIGYVFFKQKVNLTTFFNINGGICIFFIIFVFPILIHAKCRYFNDKSFPCIKNIDNNQKESKEDHIKFEGIHPRQYLQQNIPNSMIDQPIAIENPNQICDQNRKILQYSKNKNIWKIVQLTTMSIMGCYGFTLMMVTIWNVMISKMV